jgi:hypothetical protein
MYVEMIALAPTDPPPPEMGSVAEFIADLTQREKKQVAS